MIFGITSKIAIERAMPKRFHQLPILNLSMSNWIADGASLVCLNGFLANQIVQVFKSFDNTAHLVHTGIGVGGRKGDGGGDDELWLEIACKAHLCISSAIVNY